MIFSATTYAVFILSVVALFSLDLYFHRNNMVISLKSASMWSIFYISAAMAFAYYLFLINGKEAASLFITGYTLEKVLAFDNLFVFSMIFAYFKISDFEQHRALHWGIGGAVVFRLIFVVIGVGFMSLIGPTVELIFAALIIFSIYMIIKAGDDSENYEDTGYMRLAKKIFPGMTTFMMAVITIEISDILFSFDSVPAIIAVTKEPFLIYSSMLFAILGLRSLYFVIAALSNLLIFMDQAIIAVLGFIALKLVLSSLFGFHIDPVTSLLIIISVLAFGCIASLIRGNNEYKEET